MQRCKVAKLGFWARNAGRPFAGGWRKGAVDFDELLEMRTMQLLGKARAAMHLAMLATAKLADMSQLVLCGNVQVSTQAIQTLCEASIPVVYLSTGHWFYGISHGINLRNAYDRAA